MNFKQLNERVIKWADEKGILENSTSYDQIKKTIEEVEETKEAIFADLNKLKGYVNSKGEYKGTYAEIVDGFGDILVTVLIGCKMQNLDPLFCLKESLNVIEKRTGKMINGQFVKDK